MAKLDKDTIERIREEVIRGRSRYDVAAEFGVSPRTIYDYTDDLPKKWKRGISQAKKDLIFKGAEEGKSMLQISREVDVSYQTVSKFVKEVSTPDTRWPGAKGKALELLIELSENGYSMSSDKRTFRRVLSYFPTARRINFKGQTICFMDEKRVEALDAFLENRRVRIKSYKELKTLGEIFDVKIDRAKKEALLRGS